MSFSTILLDFFKKIPAPSSEEAIFFIMVQFSILIVFWDVICNPPPLLLEILLFFMVNSVEYTDNIPPAYGAELLNIKELIISTFST